MDAAALFDDARRRLDGTPREALGRRELPGRVRSALGARPRIVPAGEAWRLGILLLTDDAVLAAGEILRAAAERRRGFTAEASRQRAELQAMCSRGGFAEGATVNIDPTPLDLDVLAVGGRTGPLEMRGTQVLVHWTPGADPMSLEAYLDERIRLLPDL